MILALIILGSIVAYGLIAGVLHEFFPASIYGFTFERGANYAWSIFWPIFLVGLFVISVSIGPFKFGKWLIKALDERFDFRK